MLFLDPSELPRAAELAVAELLEEPDTWTVRYVWSNEKREPGPGFSVVVRGTEGQIRAFTVMPLMRGRNVEYEVWEVT